MTDFACGHIAKHEHFFPFETCTLCGSECIAISVTKPAAHITVGFTVLSNY